MAGNSMTLGQPTDGSFKNSKNIPKFKIEDFDDELKEEIYKEHWSTWRKDGLKDLEFTIQDES